MESNIHIMEYANEAEFSGILRKLTSENKVCLLDCARLCRIAEEAARKVGGRRTGNRPGSAIRTLNTKRR
jgi:hypothetical protein